METKSPVEGHREGVFKSLARGNSRGATADLDSSISRDIYVPLTVAERTMKLMLERRARSSWTQKANAKISQRWRSL
jgi:hypothetical protein